jgi:hypothetical protein
LHLPRSSHAETSFLTITHYNHAKTELMTTTFSRHAETFGQLHIPDMLKLIFLNHYRHVQTYFLTTAQYSHAETIILKTIYSLIHSQLNLVSELFSSCFATVNSLNLLRNKIRKQIGESELKNCFSLVSDCFTRASPELEPVVYIMQNKKFKPRITQEIYISAIAKR